MGRTAIILVVGLGLAFGFISNSIRSSVNLLTEGAASYNKYSIARNLARTAVHLNLRAYDIPLDPIPTSGVFNGGSWVIKDSTNVDTLWITSTGAYAESSYTMQLRLLRSTKPFFTPNAGLELKANLRSLDISGQPSVDGHNYNLAGTALVGSGDMPGITISNPADTTDIKSATTGQGKGNVLSLSGTPNYRIDSTAIDPAQYISEYEASADNVYNLTNLPNKPVWGTVSPLNPQITFIDAGADTSNSIEITGNTSGFGILVLRGNVKISGTFTFTGLVIFDGNSNIFNVEESGTADITGGMIVSGNAVNVSLKGTGNNGKVKYSSAALEAAKNIGKLRYYKILSWYE